MQNWYKTAQTFEHGDHYFDIGHAGHGNGTRPRGERPILWAYYNGKMHTAVSQNEHFGNTHDDKFPNMYDFGANVWKGRYEPDTGKVSVADAYLNKHLPTVVLDALKQTFKWITTIYSYGASKNWYKIAQNDLSQDQKYLEAVKSGDLVAAQQMIDAALNAKGYTIGPVYHGSPNTEFTSFNIPSKGVNSNVLGSWDVSRNAAFFTEDKTAASGYARGGSTRRFFLTGSFLDFRRGISEGTENSLVNNGVNPRWLSLVGGSWEMFDQEQDPNGVFPKALKAMGYDGAIIRDTDGTNSFDSYAVIDPSVIALAEPSAL